MTPSFCIFCAKNARTDLTKSFGGATVQTVTKARFDFVEIDFANTIL